MRRTCSDMTEDTRADTESHFVNGMDIFKYITFTMEEGL